MKGTNTAIAPLGGLQQRQPADPASAYVLQNWTADPETEGFSTRLGYERYVPTSGINFAPFSALGGIDSLYCFNAGVSGNKYALLLESGGTLYFLYEAGGSTAANYTPSLEVIRSNRARPGTAVPGSQYCTINEQCIVTNGHDAPLIMQLWPLASYGEVDSVILKEVVRSLGFNSSPPAPRVRGVTTIDAATPGTSQDVAGDTVSITWWTADRAKTIPVVSVLVILVQIRPTSMLMLCSLFTRMAAKAH